MSFDDPYLDALLARLSQSGEMAVIPVAAIAAANAEPAPAEASDSAERPFVERRRASRVEHLRTGAPATSDEATGTTNSSAVTEGPLPAPFLPPPPTSLAEARLLESEVESLILKFVMQRITASGREIAEQVKLPFALLEQLLFQLKADQLVIHKGAAPLGDYLYQLTQAGHDEARRAARSSAYCESAPVHLDDYIASVKAQSVINRPLSAEQLDAALSDLLVDPVVKNQVGQALYAGHGFFIYGAPGNGKTSIAERIGRAFGQTIWIPRAIGVDGEIIRLFDACKHIVAPLEPNEGIDPRNVDRRWIRIQRPTITVGGELTLERLEITVNRQSGTTEAPLQLKSNCGTLIIDDFGRQRCSTTDLLNRWIVPLDKRYDFLHLPSGKTIEVPFDQVLIFSTNLEPRDLVDEAFLRRIPYKIEVFDPSEAEFRQLCQIYAQRVGLGFDAAAVEYLIETHYRAAGRRFRFCHARDLVLHIRNYCQFNRLPVQMTPAAFDIAARNYFAIMGSLAAGLPETATR